MKEVLNIIYIVVSILSVLLYVLSVQFKDKKNILLIQIFAALCYLTVYITKFAWMGASIEVIESVKDYVFIKIEKKHKKIPIYVLSIFISLLVLASIIFYDGVLSLLPLFINIILFASTYFKNPKYIRYVMLLTGIMWGMYNLYIGASIIVIGNALEVISALISIIRFKDEDKKKRKKKK